MKRVMLKLSGEALAGEKKTGFDEETVRGVALQVKQLVDDGFSLSDSAPNFPFSFKIPLAAGQVFRR